MGAFGVLLVPLCTAALVGRPAALPTQLQYPNPYTLVRTPPVVAAERASGNLWRRVVGGLRNALFVGAAGVLVRSPVAPEALAAKAPPPTARKKEVSTNGLPTLATIAMGGGLVYWSVKTAAEEDEEELQRVKEETQKLESMAKEYTDIDEGVTVDEDLFASLRSRLNSTETIEGSGDGPDGTDGSSPLPPASPPSPTPSGGGSAVLDAPKPEDEPPSPGASAEDIERLKRMFGTDKS
ncbi:hypothetical protein AB1Y20_004373 [Prymnesium parvum]|uniref:Uncharacterized protein n=1 Tax=Prymnesium parvum TaxID=97485 RepID=A0AB34IW15_PRYPA